MTTEQGSAHLWARSVSMNKILVEYGSFRVLFSMASFLLKQQSGMLASEGRHVDRTAGNLCCSALSRKPMPVPAVEAREVSDNPVDYTQARAAFFSCPEMQVWQGAGGLVVTVDMCVSLGLYPGAFQPSSSAFDGCLRTTQTERQRKETLYLWKYQITGKKIGGNWLEIRMRHHLQMGATGPFLGWGKGCEGSWLSSLGERVNRLKKQCRWANKMAEPSWKPNQNSTMRYALRLDRAVLYCLLETGHVIYPPGFLISDMRRKLTLN